MLGFSELLVKEVKLTPKKAIISTQESSRGYDAPCNKYMKV